MEQERAYYLLERGMELLEGGDPAQAAVVLERARSVAPRKGSILEALGRAYYSYRRYGAAAACFEEALEVDPTNDYAHYCLGRCCLKQGNSSRAAGHFKLAWSLRPVEDYRDMARRFGVTGSAEAPAAETG
jgi:tetratricopeptide (TPR) repeat protein